MTDLWLFTKLLFEVGMLCGFVPGIAIVILFDKFGRSRRGERNPLTRVCLIRDYAAEARAARGDSEINVAVAG